MELPQPAINFEEQLRRSGGRSSRHSIVSVRLTRSEQAELDRMAKADRKALSEWCRDALLAAARGETITPTFTEIIAIRALLNSTMRLLLTGEQLSNEEFSQELQSIRSQKHQAAIEMMQQYAATGEKR